MNLPFFKYQGAGNDFILIDERSEVYPLDSNRIRFLCDRHFGIGADGFMRLQAEPGYDFRMVYYNSDGHESTLCGNGGRCMIAFAAYLGIIDTHARFIAMDGVHEGYLLPDATVRLKMQDCKPAEKHNQGYFLNTGSPHLVCFTENLNDFPVVAEGRRLRNLAEYQPGGLNVNFVAKSGSSWHIRTYERGVEDETLACGTGTTAAALCLAGLDPALPSPVGLQTRGGLLRVHFERTAGQFTEVWLEGPAIQVFSGNIEGI